MNSKLDNLSAQLLVSKNDLRLLESVLNDLTNAISSPGETISAQAYEDLLPGLHERIEKVKHLIARLEAKGRS